MLTDGTSLEGYVFKQDDLYGLKDMSIKPLFADLSLFWAYAQAYRSTGDEFMWEMARNIALGNSFGDIGRSSRDVSKLQADIVCSDVYGLLGFLALYDRSNKLEFLEMAKSIGDAIVVTKFHKGFFVPSKEHIYTRFDCYEPLALLHLYASIEPFMRYVPEIWPSSPNFVPAYRYKRRGVDRRIIYTLTESNEPPLSLQEAATIGNLNVVTSLLESGVEIDSWDDPYRSTALQCASISGHKEVVELLLDKGARVNAKDAFPAATALNYAAERGHKEIVQLLIVHGADVNATRGYPAGDTPLHTAAKAGRSDIVELLLVKGADVNIKNWPGQTPLDIAMDRGYKDIAELLLDKGADINSANNLGNTPLHRVAADALKEMAELLIDKGADINAKNNNGQTPLYIAVNQGHKDIAELLISKGADINVGTALHSALDEDKFDIAELLVAKGADVNARDEVGRTPLHIAAKPGIVELLLSKGADVNAKDNDGRTVLSYAIEYSPPEVAEILRKHGAKEEGEEEKAPESTSKNISPTNSGKHYVVLERGDVRAVIVNNEPVDEEVLP
jgi:cytohesin